jgi:hypothetical protein
MFDFPVWTESQPPVLNLASPAPKVYRPGTEADDNQPTADFIAMANAPATELSNAPVFPVGGIVDPPPAARRAGARRPTTSQWPGRWRSSSAGRAPS